MFYTSTGTKTNMRVFLSETGPATVPGKIKTRRFLSENANDRNADPFRPLFAVHTHVG